jgi:hypothetical protein
MNVIFVNGFLNLLKEFLDSMKVLLPIWDDILAAQKTIELAEWSTSSKIAVVDNFMYYIFPFYKHILLRKEVFFMDPDNIAKSDRFKESNQETQNTNYTKLFELKSVWQQFAGYNKHTVWNYFCGLVINGARATSTKEYKEILQWAEENKEAILEAAKKTESV